MKNFVSEGEILTLTAPSGGVVSGTPKQIGQLLVVPVVDAAQGESFSAKRTGVFSGLPKATGAAWAEGDILYWSGTNLTKTTTGNFSAGFAVAAAAAGDATGTAYLHGIAGPDLA